jgi:hypothetical protein
VTQKLALLILITDQSRHKGHTPAIKLMRFSGINNYILSYKYHGPTNLDNSNSACDPVLLRSFHFLLECPKQGVSIVIKDIGTKFYK